MVSYSVPEFADRAGLSRASAAQLRLAITRTARRLRQEAGDGPRPRPDRRAGTIERHGPLTPSELAELERVQRPTATRIVARLERGRAGRARRATPPTGARSLVSSKPQGRALLRRLRTRKNAYLARRLRELDADDLATLDRAAEILERLLEGERR